MQLALFDFDGTITTKDSIMDFVRFAVGPFKFLIGVVLLSPLLVGYALRLVSNTFIKEFGFKLFFRNWDFSRFSKITSDYSRLRLPKLIREKALKQITWHKSQGHHVVVVTASFEEILADWCRNQQIDLISNTLDIQDGYITGKIKNENCYGPGKAEKIVKILDLKQYSHIYAYGDSDGDRAMFALADESFYRIF